MSSSENAHLLANPSAKRKEGNNVIIHPLGMDIVWAGDSRYWSIPKENDNSPAKLHQVCWLEVTTSLQNTETETYICPNKKYEVGFKISFESDAFGWGSNYPIYFMTKRGNKKPSWNKIVLNKGGNDLINWEVDSYPKSSEADDIISFGLYEVWSGKWKGGLNIHYAYVKEIKSSSSKTGKRCVF